MLTNRLSTGWRQELAPLEPGFRRILVMRLDNIGDMVILSPALSAIRAAYPQAAITLMASPTGSQVAPMLPWIDEVIVHRAAWQDISARDDEQDTAQEWDLIQRLRERRFEAAFIFTSFTQSPYPPAYACSLAGIPVRVGQSKEFGGRVLTHCAQPPPDSGHQIDRNLSLLEAVGIHVAETRMSLHISDETQASADELLRSVEIEPGQPFIALAPGASCAARRYDPARFASAARMLSTAAALPILLVGSPREAPLVQDILTHTENGLPKPVRSLTGQTSVPEMAAILRRASLVLANNSAAMHLAEVFERPMVILYSGTEYESQWKPRHTPARLLRRPTPCSPCFRFSCPFAMECLDIPPEEVVSAALELLSLEVVKPGTQSGATIDKRQEGSNGQSS